MGNKTNNCKFCSIIQDKMELIYEDDIIVLFHDIKPEAKIHIQSVPKIHIDNINHLTKNDIKLLKHMKEKSAEFIKKIYGESAEIK